MRSAYLLIGIAAFLLIALVLMKLYGSKTVEGYRTPGKKVSRPKKTKGGDVPEPEGDSTVPNTMPGSTTANSKDAVASFKDISSLLDSIKTFNILYENNIQTVEKVKKYKNLRVNAQAYQVKLKAQLDTQTPVEKLDFVTKERKKYDAAVKELRGSQKKMDANNKKTAENKVKKSFGNAKDITLADLNKVIARAKEEQKRIDDLRSESTDLKRRSQNLERVRLDLTGFVDRIKKGDMSIKDVPLTRTQLRSFLLEVENPTAKVSPLPKLKPAQKGAKSGSGSGKGSAATGGQIAGPGGIDLNAGAIAQQLRAATRDLAWEVHVGYDPQTTIQRRMFERLNVLGNQLQSGRLSGEERKARLLEMEIIQQQLQSINKRKVAEARDDLAPYETFDSSPAQPGVADDLTEAYAPAPVEPVGPQFNPDRSIITTLEPPIPSNDWRKRPGYQMSTDEIAKRGSAASFHDTVSGPDYKQRAKFLCQQIKNSDLGNPSEFGCINDPDKDVGAEYSWKGNYKMVCARLGRTWGGWYPEMFGCPPDDVSGTAIPKVKINP